MLYMIHVRFYHDRTSLASETHQLDLHPPLYSCDDIIIQQSMLNINNVKLSYDAHVSLWAWVCDLCQIFCVCFFSVGVSVFFVLFFQETHVSGRPGPRWED